MSNRIYLIEKGKWRKFLEYQDEDFVRLVIQAKQGGEWAETNSTPVSRQAVLAAAKLLNIPLAPEQPDADEADAASIKARWSG